MLEFREEKVGGTFRYRSYENAELVSSKQLTAFSDHRIDGPDHISLPAVSGWHGLKQNQGSSEEFTNADQVSC